MTVRWGIAGPGVIIDTDNWPIKDRAMWRSYVKRQPELGVPALYFATHIDRTGEPLTRPLRLAGTPLVHLVASTSGTDSDWVVKLIDVYPDSARDPLAGYRLGIAMEVMRARYRDDTAHATPVPPNQPVVYEFALPQVDYVVRPGHRLMVQVQSSWFPLYDRNPQHFVPNIFFARPQDYQRATQRIAYGPNGTWIGLPIVK